MPYIRPEDRDKFCKVLADLPTIEDKGELEFCVYALMQMYMMHKDERYSPLHDCVYAVIHAAEEFKRRRLDVREDAARLENGDIK